MEQVKTNWLQKAIAIITGLAIALGLAFAFAPAKAWAVSTITGIEVTGYEDPVAGEWASDNWGKLGLVVTPSDIPAGNLGSARGWYIKDTNEQVSTFEAGESCYLLIELWSRDNNESFSSSFDEDSVSIPGATVAKVEKKSILGGEYVYIYTEPYTIPEEPSITYKMTSGDDATWTKGSTAGLTFVSEAPFDKFLNIVTVNDEGVDAKNWTAVAGSTKVTLKAEYLETLAPGTYTMTIVSTDGITPGKFTIKAAGAAADDTSGTNDEKTSPKADDKTGTNDGKTSPKTGVDTAPLAATTLVFAIGVLTAGAYIFRTRKEGVK